MEITTTEYSVKYDPEADTISLQGSMRLNGHEYQTIMQFLEQVTALEPAMLKLDLRQLKVLNSSGISMLGRFVFSLGKKQTIPLTIKGSHDIAWQDKWARNFQLLMPSLTLEWE